jgi:hypothetical protein
MAEMTKEAKTARQACHETYFLGSFLPKTARIKVLRAGIKGMSQKISVILAFHQFDVFRLDCLFLPEYEENDGQANSRLSSSNSDNEKDYNLAVDGIGCICQSDKGEVGGIEHNFNGHEHGD